MSACDDIRTDLGGYVLGALEPEEADAVREHLERCSACAREHAALADLPALLTLAEPIEAAPPLAPAVEERVLDAVARGRPRPEPRRNRLLRRPRLLIPAFAALAAVIVAAVFALGGDGPHRYDVAFEPVGSSTAGGHTQLESTPGGTRLRMWVKGLPADPSVVYEVRCEAPDWSASAGTFRVDSSGKAFVVLTTAAQRGQYDSIRVVRRSSDTDVLTASLN